MCLTESGVVEKAGLLIGSAPTKGGRTSPFVQPDGDTWVKGYRIRALVLVKVLRSSRPRLSNQNQCARRSRTQTEGCNSLPHSGQGFAYFSWFSRMSATERCDLSILSCSYLAPAKTFTPSRDACGHARATCLGLRQKYSLVRFNRSADAGSIPNIFPSMRNVVLSCGILTGIINV